MSMLTNLEKAIEELEIQKDEIFQKIKSIGWEDDRHFETIPEKRKIVKGGFDDDLLDRFKDREIITPERRPLPSEIGRMYQKWYGAARVIIERNQTARLYEFDDLYHIQDKKEKGQAIRIKQL